MECSRELTMRRVSTRTSVDKFKPLQLRSVLDQIGNDWDETWANMVASASEHADTSIALALPSTTGAEDGLRNAVVALTEALASAEELAGFYKHFGWSSPEEYFGVLGESQAMIVDMDHNDLDDRLAVILLAFQIASANLERRRRGDIAAASVCTLFLDTRTYETTSGLTVWRTACLGARLSQVFESLGCGLSVTPILVDRRTAKKLVADELGLSVEALGARVTRAASYFSNEGGCPANFHDCLQSGSRSSIWILSGLCAAQVKDVLCCQGAQVHLNIFEQAQPAWQSMEVARPGDGDSADCQPAWSFPPDASSAVGFGAEPSNIRSSAENYSSTLENYVRFQQIVAKFPASFTYVAPALARTDSFMPVPPGQSMIRISGRPLTVLPGEEYVVKKAVNPEKLAKAFAELMANAHKFQPDTIHVELCISTEDCNGIERTEVQHIRKHGTFMADAIAVALAARPLAQLDHKMVTRRLAIVRVPELIE